MTPIQMWRDVVNKDGLTRIRDTLGLTPMKDPFHITQIYSRAAVDWSKPVFAPSPEQMLIQARDLEIHRFGDIIVAKVVSPGLMSRFDALIQAGATWDFPEYQPHISLGRVNWSMKAIPTTITPDTALILGPEQRKVPAHVHT